MNDLKITRLQRHARGWTVGVASLFLAGCTTLRATEAPDVDVLLLENEVLTVSEESAAFAKALAHFGRAHLHELNREFDEALAQYRLALTYDPNHLNTYLRLALIHMRRDEADQAISLLQDLTQRRPNEAQPWIWLGSTYRHTRNLEGATSAYETARQRDPHNAAIYIQLVDLLIQQGDEQGAIALLMEGLEKAAEPVSLYRVLGEMYMRQAGLLPRTEEAREYVDRAILTFEAALDIQPDETSILSSLGDLYFRVRRIDDAVAVYERVRALLPADLAVKERLVLAYELAGKLDNAAMLLEEIAAQQPTNARVFLALGGLYERLGQEERAILNYNLAARIGRPDPVPYLKLGALQIEDNPDAAATALREGLELLPGNPHLLEMLAYVLFNQKKYAEAVDAFVQAQQEQDPDEQVVTSPNFYLYLSLSYYFTDEADKSAVALRNAMDLNPDALEAFTHLIFQDDDEERSAQAVTIFGNLRQAYPNDPLLLTMLAYVHSFQKDYATAVDYFSQAYDLATEQQDARILENARFFFWFGAAHEREENRDLAVQWLYRCLELDPQNAEAYNYLAYMWAERGENLDKALEYVHIALEQRPDSGAFIDTLGWIYYQQGRYEEAYTEIKRAAEIIPDDPTILDHLGDIYLKLDDAEQALAKWARSYALDPENEEVARKLTEQGVDITVLIKEEMVDESQTDDAETEGETAPDDATEEQEPADTPDAGPEEDVIDPATDTEDHPSL